MKRLLSGNEAVARGAYECGCTFAAGYPGTPSTEILETLSRYPGVSCRWAPNEKVAYETAVGASLGGARALVTMKHVGVNVAADPLFSHSYMGVGAGFVLISADDPGMHSSQNEQDNRHLARAAKVPLIEPSTSAEAKAMVETAFLLSEAYDTPVMLRMTTNVCHSVGEVRVAEPRYPERRPFVRNFRKLVLLPAHARARHVAVEKRLERLEAEEDRWPTLFQESSGSPELGILSSGASWLYARECFPDASHLKLGLTYPFPRARVREFAARVKRLLVVEEGDPFLEEQVRALGLEVEGQRLRPPTGELSPELVLRMVGGDGQPVAAPAPASLPVRPPVLCAGCSHRGVFTALQRLGKIVAGDIGCYTLGALPPLSSMDTCLCMGASIGMATGLEAALGATGGEDERKKVVAVIGDSTFLHSGVTGLMDAVYNRGTGTFLVLDNRITAMTGHQPHPGAGRGIDGKPAPRVDIPALARAVGVERVRTADAYQVLDLENAIREETAAASPSVIVVESPCVLHERKVFGPPVKVSPALCTHCESCLRVGCPSIGFAEHTPTVNPETCIGCTVCQQVCYNCPAANDVAGFLQLAAEKRYGEALDLLLATNPFPSITGRVCPHPCELEFNALGLQLEWLFERRFGSLSKEFKSADGRLSVRAVERFLGDHGLDRPGTGRRAPQRDGRVAVVGSGPAGLSCAWYLAQAGHPVTVFEQLPEVGGMLRAGIPGFRLPRDILSKNLARLTDLGVVFRTDAVVGHDPGFEQLDRDFDALFLATGFSEGRAIGVEGEELPGVLRGLELLRDINLGRPVAVGKRVLVVGGGNTAIDVARTVKRMGSRPVIAYRRALDDMPAIAEEVQALGREDIPIQAYVAPLRIAKADGGLQVTLVKMKPGEFDESGRRKPVPIEGSEFVEEFDQVVTAVGERAGLSLLPASVRHDERLVTTDFASATNLKGVFAGGDLSTGFGTVAHAIRSGRKGAEAVAAYLDGRS